MTWNNYGPNLTNIAWVQTQLFKLPKQYLEMDVGIHIINTLEDMAEQLALEDYLMVYANNLQGFFSPEDKSIVIFACLMDEDFLDEVNFLFTILHEIRHAYQFTFLNHLYMNEKRRGNIMPSEDREGYRNQWTERDADNFAEEWTRLICEEEE